MDLNRKVENNDILLVTGVEDGWIAVDKETWAKYTEAKNRLKEAYKKWEYIFEPISSKKELKEMKKMFRAD